MSLLPEVLNHAITAIDWSHLIAAGVGAAMTWCVSALAKALVTVPAKALLTRYRMIKLFAQLFSLVRHKTFSGKWQVIWEVDSSRFPITNASDGTLYSLFGSMAIEVEFKDNDNNKRAYHFVGKKFDSIITGEWFDGIISKEGYFGSFQIAVDQMGTSAAGQWIGFSSTRTVKGGELIWKKTS